MKKIKILERDGQKFTVSETAYARYPELIGLLMRSDSIPPSDESDGNMGKQYWLDLLDGKPADDGIRISDEQIDTLYDTLVSENSRLEKMESKYRAISDFLRSGKKIRNRGKRIQ